MEIFWLELGRATPFDASCHLPRAQLALYWEIDAAGLMVLFSEMGERNRIREAVSALPRFRGRYRIPAGVAYITNRGQQIDWRSHRYAFTTLPEIQQKMRQALRI